MRLRLIISILVCVLIAVTLVLSVNETTRSDSGGVFTSRYLTKYGQASQCTTCHTSIPSGNANITACRTGIDGAECGLNTYGLALKLKLTPHSGLVTTANARNAINAVDVLDLDSDGFDTGPEITRGSDPASADATLDVDITASGFPDEVVEGDPLVFAVEVKNSAAPANGSPFPLPDLSDLSATATVVNATGTFACEAAPGPLAAGATQSLSCTGNVTDEMIDNNKLTLRAVASAQWPSGDAIAAADATVTLTADVAAFELDAQADKSQVQQGEQVVFSFTVRNPGRVALSNVAITPAIAGCAVAPVTTLAAGQSEQRTCTVQLLASLSNRTVTATADTAGGRGLDAASDPLNVTVDGGDALQLKLTLPVGPAVQGEPVPMVVDVDNSGLTALDQIDVRFPAFPDCDEALDQLAPNGSHSYSCAVVPPTVGLLTVSGVGAALQANVAITVPVAATLNVIARAPALEITIDQIAYSGGTAQVGYTVSNAGNATLRDLEIRGIGLSGCETTSEELGPQASRQDSCTAKADGAFVDHRNGRRILSLTLAAAADDVFDGQLFSSADRRMVDVSNLVYLPHLRRQLEPLDTHPDLVVDSVRFSSYTMELIIRNLSNVAVPAGSSFVVDLYVDPTSPPDGINQPPMSRGSFGATWHVALNGLSLGAGTTLRLFLDAVEDARLQQATLPTTLSPSTSVFVHVDSTGTIGERDEVDGTLKYNNILKVNPPRSISTARWRLQRLTD